MKDFFHRSLYCELAGCCIKAFNRIEPMYHCMLVNELCCISLFFVTLESFAYYLLLLLLLLLFIFVLLLLFTLDAALSYYVPQRTLFYFSKPNA